MTKNEFHLWLRAEIASIERSSPRRCKTPPYRAVGVQRRADRSALELLRTALADLSRETAQEVFEEAMGEYAEGLTYGR